MKYKKTVPDKIVPAHEEHDYTECDGCKKSRTSHEWGDAIEWGVGAYNVEKTTVRYESGHNYPDSGNTRVIEYHLCPTCFNDLIHSELQSRGIVGTEEDHDW